MALADYSAASPFLSIDWPGERQHCFDLSHGKGLRDDARCSRGSTGDPSPAVLQQFVSKGCWGGLHLMLERADDIVYGLRRALRRRSRLFEVVRVLDAAVDISLDIVKRAALVNSTVFQATLQRHACAHLLEFAQVQVVAVGKYLVMVIGASAAASYPTEPAAKSAPR
eukprot:1104609-Pyramimonas_sp.AAC.1